MKHPKSSQERSELCLETQHRAGPREAGSQIAPGTYSYQIQVCKAHAGQGPSIACHQQPGTQGPTGPAVPTPGLTASQSRAPGPFLLMLTSALWKQLLLEGLSISLFLQEINTPHKVNGGFRQGAFTSSLSGLRLCSAPMTDPQTPADSKQAWRSWHGRQAWRPAAVC